MPGIRSRSELWLWSAVAIAVAALLAALYPLQFALDALRARNLLRLTIAAIFVSCAATVVAFLARRRAPLVAWLVIGLFSTLYAALALAMEVPQERLHLVEYGALALLLRGAMAESVRVRNLAGRVSSVDVWALGAATAIGWLDEAVQGLLPNRTYDLRDVAFNALAAAMALVAAAAARKAMGTAEGSRQKPER